MENNNLKDNTNFVLHFYDWYGNRTKVPTNSEKWTHKVDWNSLGLREEEICDSEKYYEIEFKLIKDLGIDCISYQYYGNESIDYVTQNLVNQIEENDMKICLFFDWEIRKNLGSPIMSSSQYINPSLNSVQEFKNILISFYEQIPRNLWLIKNNKLILYVFGFGFSDCRDKNQWISFWKEIINSIKEYAQIEPLIYWSCINNYGYEVGLQHFPEHIRAFNFVLDMPRYQMGKGSVTWNFDFDNLGVQRYCNLQRVVRNDIRYLQEMIWLACNTNPDNIFIYSWNEFYEGSSIHPDASYGFKKYELAKELIKETKIKIGEYKKQPKVLLVVDDLAEEKELGWKRYIEEYMLMYPMRRILPFSEVVIIENFHKINTKEFSHIVFLSQNVSDKINFETIQDKNLLFFSNSIGKLKFNLIYEEAYSVFNKEIQIENNNEKSNVFVRDDVKKVKILEETEAFGILNEDKNMPVLLKKENIHWANFFSVNDLAFKIVFETFFNKKMSNSIMYGEGTESERHEFSPDGHYFHRNFSAASYIQHPDLPVVWEPLPIVKNNYKCNITGNEFNLNDSEKHRELGNRFGANSRHRAIIYFLTKNLFGQSKILSQVNKNKNIKGIGMSDSGFDQALKEKFNYVNTFYHQEPFLDIYKEDSVNKYKNLDFIICSEIFEHINPFPGLQLAFNNLYKMLKPGGFVIFSVPYTEGEHIEHYPSLFNYKIKKIDDKYIIENETIDGKKEFFSNPYFHGGPGATVEMRIFSKKSIIEYFEIAGFREIVFNGIDKEANSHGIYWTNKLDKIMTVFK